MPMLAALRDNSGRLSSVAGWRSAEHGPLYLEAYLKLPVEQELSSRTDRPIERGEIVEVGNLASGGCRTARLLVALLPRLLLAQGHRWIVFTATIGVRRILENLEAPVMELAPAVAACVAGRDDRWGRYYDADPRVMAGYLPDGVRLIAALNSLRRKPRRA
jgi:hypothetical protein